MEVYDVNRRQWPQGYRDTTSGFSLKTLACSKQTFMNSSSFLTYFVLHWRRTVEVTVKWSSRLYRRPLIVDSKGRKTDASNVKLVFIYISIVMEPSLSTAKQCLMRQASFRPPTSYASHAVNDWPASLRVIIVITFRNKSAMKYDHPFTDWLQRHSGDCKIFFKFFSNPGYRNVLTRWPTEHSFCNRVHICYNKSQKQPICLLYTACYLHLIFRGH